MATYSGAILSVDEVANYEPKVFEGAVKLKVADYNSELEQKVFDAVKIELFIFGDEGDLASKKVRRLNGHTTWGDDNVKPRRYPLETSWTKKN